MNWDLIPRNNYLDFLIRNRDLKIIKVITGAKAKPKLPPATQQDITRPKLDLLERKVAREVPRGCIAATANPKKNKIGKTGGRLFK